jgi:hypothetical protein
MFKQQTSTIKSLKQGARSEKQKIPLNAKDAQLLWPLVL